MFALITFLASCNLIIRIIAPLFNLWENMVYMQLDIILRASPTVSTSEIITSQDSKTFLKSCGALIGIAKIIRPTAALRTTIYLEG